MLITLTLGTSNDAALLLSSVKTESSFSPPFESDSNSSSDSRIVVATSMNLVVDDLRLTDLA